MKLLAVNGSPNKEGNTFHALQAVLNEAKACSVETEMIQIGDKAIRGCVACGGCYDSGLCVFADDDFKTFSDKMYAADGIVVGTPVYYSGPNGTVKSFLDRVFYQSGGRMRHKPCAAVAVPRRTGGMPALEQIHNFFMISEMILVGSYYWNVAHGTEPGEVIKDGEGMSVMSNLGRNLAWVMKLIDNGKETLPAPNQFPRGWTNFIR